jgi:hypothetical protein
MMMHNGQGRHTMPLLRRTEIGVKVFDPAGERRKVLSEV